MKHLNPVFVVAALLVACASPNTPADIPCTTDSQCPNGQVCSRGVCTTPGVADGGPAVDGGAVDGGTPADGGTVLDGGTALDGGTPLDGGAPADGGAAVDGGAATDGGTPDAGGGGAFGTTCNANGDCQSGICIQTSAGGICSKPCSQDCPVDWGCRLVNLTPVCVPPELTICATCADDSECGGSFGCTTYAGAKVCLLKCTDQIQCGANQECRLIDNADGGVAIGDGGVPADGGVEGRCVPVNNLNNCGACGNVCGAGEQCCGNRCVNTNTDELLCGSTCATATACGPDTQCCGGVCIDTRFSDTHCGACLGEGGASCSGQDMKCCGGSCVSVRDNDSHCGSCDACGGSEKCCGLSCRNLATDPGNCQMCGTSCQPAQACCGAEGCTAVLSNDQHCGACGNDCLTQFGASAGNCCGTTCVNKLTDRTACGENCTTCGGVNPDCCDGVCYDLDSDKNHCGACSGANTTCTATEGCCGGNCMDLQTDENNCGQCGNKCGTNQECCGGQCKDKLTDPNNCGSCGHICNAGETCCSGGCKNLNTDATFCGTTCANATNCGAGSSCCSGGCQNTTSGDTTNCGGCGIICGTTVILPNVQTYTCSSSTCGIGQCANGWADCNANPGCETQRLTNTTCGTANNLGTIYDWDGSGPIEVTQTNVAIVQGQSLWFKVHAADPPFDDWKLLAKVFNVSAGMNVDLYAYRRASGNTCSTNPMVPSGTCNQNISGCGGGQENSNRCSVNTGTANECVSWFESCTGTLEDDETEIWVEVRHISGGCGTFDLKIRNNGNNDSLTCANF